MSMVGIEFQDYSIHPDKVKKDDNTKEKKIQTGLKVNQLTDMLAIRDSN